MSNNYNLQRQYSNFDKKSEDLSVKKCVGLAWNDPYGTLNRHVCNLLMMPGFVF